MDQSNKIPNVPTDITEKKQGKGTGKHLFKKGQSGNPNGRPVGSISIVEGIKKKLLDVEPESKKTYLQLFLEQLFKKAVDEGNEQLMKDMINRVDGMPKQFNDLTSNGKELNTVLVKFINNENDRDTN